MKVLNARTALLSDYEVLSLLQEMEADQQQGNERSSRIAEGDADDAEKRLMEKMAKVPQNLRTIQYEILSTLSQPYRPAAHQQADHIRSFHVALKAAGFIGDEILPDRALTKAERLQLVNNAPRSLVELHTLVEELGERFTESQIEELMNLVATHIPIPPT
ncbi:hypothetical protein BCV69DRAFT_233772, partial [Microstroma glucosiphilum]